MTPAGSDLTDVAAPEDRLLTRSEASAELAALGIRLKPSTLARLWSTGSNGPPCRHVRSKPLYPLGLLRVWAQDQMTEVRSGAPAAARGRRHG
ncbi:hypothetical protein E4M02_07210 [Brevundimonas sp. S30B]|uniref:hypothetical protein n=1 Tax=unclassified Brevundimonas TaxID=2622653 RepID=UPI0010718FA8|nr:MULTISPECIES: hypothetical protein [unclassified Brevundimonas]QBX37878.1 hypothetical protein E4M01_08930 [Brevundimonas sp. MF30-B]TFW02766.1 hypothetical protein E4M02_07210 [Brevundimonas sp. S30B]